LLLMSTSLVMNDSRNDEGTPAHDVIAMRRMAGQDR
jgi:hypothetical protein